jgi:FixJ family two-component response regulator
MSNRTLQSPPSSTGSLIAVVDDDVSFLRSVGRLLRSAGYTVETFDSAREFLASLDSSSPQCLVLDVHMPGMTGLELQDWLAAQGCRLPIIFVTAYDTPQTQAHAHRAGSFGLLLKPFHKTALLNAIGEAVGASPRDVKFGTGQSPTAKAS